jgi:hypothetical protein
MCRYNLEMASSEESVWLACYPIPEVNKVKARTRTPPRLPSSFPGVRQITSLDYQFMQH